MDFLESRPKAERPVGRCGRNLREIRHELGSGRRLEKKEWIRCFEGAELT
jgi:hypothetical protein